MNNIDRVRNITLRESTGRFSTVVSVFVYYDMHSGSGRACMSYRQYQRASKALGNPYSMPSIGQDIDGRNIQID